MLKLRTRTILVLMATAMTPALTQELVAQAEPAAAKPDPEVKAKLSEFKKLIKNRKGAKDAEAIQIVDGVLTGFEKLHPKDKKDFAKALYEPLKSPRVTPITMASSMEAKPTSKEMREPNRMAEKTSRP